jgi:hypothetical protein
MLEWRIRFHKKKTRKTEISFSTKKRPLKLENGTHQVDKNVKKIKNK